MKRAYSRETTRKWRAKRKEDAQRKQRKWKREQNKLREKSAKEAHADNLNIISKGDLLRNLELASRLPDYLAEAHRDYLYALRYGEDGPSFLLKKRRLQKLRIHSMKLVVVHDLDIHSQLYDIWNFGTVVCREVYFVF